MRHTTPHDPYIIYGRGGAGNIRTLYPHLFRFLPTNNTRSPLHNPQRLAQSLRCVRHNRAAVAGHEPRHVLRAFEGSEREERE